MITTLNYYRISWTTSTSKLLHKYCINTATILPITTESITTSLRVMGPWGPVKPGLEKTIHWRSRRTHTPSGGGTRCKRRRREARDSGPGARRAGRRRVGQASQADRTRQVGLRLGTRPVKSEGAPGYAFRARCVQCRGKPC